MTENNKTNQNQHKPKQTLLFSKSSDAVIVKWAQAYVGNLVGFPSAMSSTRPCCGDIW